MISNMPAKKKQIKPKKKKSATNKEISKDIIIGDLIEKYPASAEVLAKHGFHCIGCMISPYETLEAGAAVHSIPLKPLLAEINKAVK